LEVQQHHERMVEARIVYLGPGGAGRRTNLDVLRNRFAPDGAKAAPRLPTTPIEVLGLHFRGPRDARLRVDVVSVGGDDGLAPARAALVDRADVLVLVADSDPERQSSQTLWLNGLERLVRERRPGAPALPVVVQCNKSDVPMAASTMAVARALNLDGLDAVPAAAHFGEGVLETLEIALVRWIGVRSLRGDVPWLPTGEAIQPWVRRMLHATPEGVSVRFGPVVGEAAPRERQGIGHPAMSDSKTQGRKPDASSVWFAGASADLALALVHAHGSIRCLSHQLTELARAAAMAAEIPSGRFGSDLRRVLEFLQLAAAASRASFVIWAESAPLGSVPLPPLEADPLLDRMGARYLAKLAEHRRPLVCEAVDDSELAALLDGEPWVALVALPVSGGGRFLGLAILYLDAAAILPTEAELSHLGLLASVVGPPLALASRPETGPWPHSPRE
jgi:signal recognition particle receptor subunit beta